jgi:hypothetical protein
MKMLFIGPALLLALSACKGDAKSTVDSTPVSAPERVASATDTTAQKGLPCPHTGLWAQCSVERRLKQSGFVVTRIDSVFSKRAGFSVKPIVYSLGRSRLEVFLYENEKALAADVAKLDTVRVVPIGSPPDSAVVPTFIRSANLIGILTSQNARQAERVILAITAGAPQPGSPR